MIDLTSSYLRFDLNILFYYSLTFVGIVVNELSQRYPILLPTYPLVYSLTLVGLVVTELKWYAILLPI